METEVEVLWVMVSDWHLLKLGTEGTKLGMQGMWPVLEMCSVLEVCGHSWVWEVNPRVT